MSHNMAIRALLLLSPALAGIALSLYYLLRKKREYQLALAFAMTWVGVVDILRIRGGFEIALGVMFLIAAASNVWAYLKGPALPRS